MYFTQGTMKKGTVTAGTLSRLDWLRTAPSMWISLVADSKLRTANW